MTREDAEFARQLQHDAAVKALRAKRHADAMAQAGMNRYERTMQMIRDGKSDAEIMKALKVDEVTMAVYRKIQQGTISPGHPLTEAVLNSKYEGGWAYQYRMDFDKRRDRIERKLREIGEDRLRELGVEECEDPIERWDRYQQRSATISRREAAKRRKKCLEQG